MLSVAGICSTREERGIFRTNSLDCNKRGDLNVLNLSQSTVKQNGKKPTTLPFVPDNPDGRISELLLDTTVVHPLSGPNCEHKLSLIEAKQNLRAEKKKKYDVVCAQNGLKFLPIIFESTGSMHPLLQDFLVVVMDTMTMHINPQYKHVLLVCSTILLSSKVDS